ncbi:hypothetical protein [Idiomarina baltica]|uniref:Uncharacterized protein n=1 Tax=Idiomarina baltica OS145 TaxID=314276 RepID=A0ABP2CTS6_9GAMM|nr:hypothetical protein [Idiomarina baltica]EAQ33275.1 hypothetical protein OS145_02865 [Idiomarina baltica OS145]
MSSNPFASYNVELPEAYAERIRSYCSTGGKNVSSEIAPFERQVDFWFFAFVLATVEGLDLVKPSKTYNATQAHILSSNSERITYIQAVYLAESESLDGLANPRKVWDFACQRAHAGVPRLIQILSDTDQKPLWNFLDVIDNSVRA